MGNGAAIGPQYSDLPPDAKLLSGPPQEEPRYSDLPPGAKVLPSQPVTMTQARPGYSGQPFPSNRYMFGGEPRQLMGEQLQDEAAGMLHSAARVSTPNIAQQPYKRYKGLPNRLAELPDQAATFLGTMMGDAGEPEAQMAPAQAPLIDQIRSLPQGQYEAPS